MQGSNLALSTPQGRSCRPGCRMPALPPLVLSYPQRAEFLTSPCRQQGGRVPALRPPQRRPPQRRPARPLAAAPLPEAVTAGLFAGTTLYAAALTLLMAFAPRWRRTQQLMRPLAVFLPLALAYAFLLGCSWEPDTFSLVLPGSWEEGLKGGFNPQFLPELRGIMVLFSRLLTAASLWVHLLATNLFAARAVYLQGLEQNIPTWHSILLCMTLSPFGLLSHWATQALWRRRGDGVSTAGRVS